MDFTLRIGAKMGSNSFLNLWVYGSRADPTKYDVDPARTLKGILFVKYSSVCYDSMVKKRLLTCNLKEKYVLKTLFFS